ncbi:MAG TPA: elongation factor G [Actinomycetota bacterium]|nr:elongation factor G [Actinomycetota bacterium]
MKQYEPSQIRNVALVGHGGSGKTMLAEALLYASGASTRLGRVEDGTAHTDFEAEEHARQISIALAMAPIEWKGHKINVIDCPGYADFHGEVVSALRVVDACVFVVSAVDGVQVQTELIWDEAQELGLPCLIVINKLDRERASYEQALAGLQAAFGTKPFPMQIPVGQEQSFSGVVDLLSSTGYIYDQKSPAGTAGEVPADVQPQMEEAHQRLVEAAAEGDDTLMEKYFESGDLDEKETASGLRGAIAAGATAPVLVCSATHLVGVDLLADAICSLVPSPLERPAVKGVAKSGSEAEVVRAASSDDPLCALVFKTISDPYVGKISIFRVFSGHLRPDHPVTNSTQGFEERVHQIFHMIGKDHVPAPQVVTGDIGAVAKLAHTHTGDTLCEPPPIVLPPIEFPSPVYSIAVASRARGDEEKVSTSLQRLIEEDPVLRVERNSETHQTVVSALGETHLGVVIEKMKRKFGVEIDQIPLRIAYRETIKAPAKHESRYVKQSGGRGQYAVAHLEVAPLPHGGGYDFVNKIVGGAIPGNFIPSVDKGVQGAMSEGVFAGYPVVDVQVTLVDGKFHSVDSSDMAFQICASMGFKEACKKAGVSLLEPVSDVHIRVPDTMLGDIMGDVNSKRGKIMGTEPDVRGYQLVHAQVPASEMVRYAIDLRSITGGRGSFSMQFSHYEHVPQHLEQKIADQADADKKVTAGKH